MHSGRLLLRFEGVHDRTGAEALRNTLLIAEVDPRSAAGATRTSPTTTSSWTSTSSPSTGSRSSRITEISHLPSQDLFIVERPDGTEVMIPFVEEIVSETDLEEQKAIITPPPGLIDDRAEIASARHRGGRGRAEARRRHDLLPSTWNR